VCVSVYMWCVGVQVCRCVGALYVCVRVWLFICSVQVCRFVDV
jgi:hypothetical protein